ncbi:CmK2: cytidylate kinase [Desulfosarcina variabilis str. Montpellier]|uniref:(d)CMP kinase n=1 Tax=Desulfosarcina variabilis TaxID=2300 RepID=UPI003AFB4D60
MPSAQQLLITIDGPAGAGKTTLSKMLARDLKYRYLDTGALYRAVAYAIRQQDINADDDQALAKVCADLQIEFVEDRLLLDGVDISSRIRTPEITMLASAASARLPVRKALLGIQRKMGQRKGLVAEGRDMGTVVFPEADLKFFLDASIRQRALRRHAQYAEDNNEQSIEDIETDIRRRDENDSNRDIAPLRPARDAIIIDSTRLPADQVLERMLTHVHQLTCSSKC